MTDDHTNDRLHGRVSAAAFLKISTYKLDALRRAGIGPPSIKSKHGVHYRQSTLEVWRHARQQRRVPPDFPEFEVTDKFAGLDDLLSIAETVSKLGVSPETLGRWRAKGLAPQPEFTATGWRYRRRTVLEYLAYRAWLAVHWWTR